jgi:DNA-directed RNA polymerase specialized sigma24 family protein
MTPDKNELTPQETSDPIRLMLAYLCISSEKEASLETKVNILARFALTNAEIATVCGSKVQSVKNARHSLRKQGTKTKNHA